MKYSRIPTLTLAAALCVAGAACSDNSAADSATANADADIATPPADTVSATSDGAQFLTDAMKGSNGEVRLGQLAADKGSSQGVKDFGAMLAKDHGAAKQEMASLASSMNLPATEETKPEADAEYTKLQALSGADFDREFVSYMIDQHQKGVAKFQAEATSGDPQPVTQLAAKTVPTLQKHLETARSLQ